MPSFEKRMSNYSERRVVERGGTKDPSGSLEIKVNEWKPLTPVFGSQVFVCTGNTVSY